MKAEKVHAAAAASATAALQAEESVIGACLLHPEVLPSVVKRVSVRDLTHPALSAIYEAMVECERAGRPIDPLTVAEQMRALETFDKLRAFKGTDYFIELQSKVFSVDNIEYHARMIADAALRRRLRKRLSEAIEATHTDKDVDELVERVQRIADDERPGSTDDALPALASVAAQIDWAQPLPPAVPTGIADLDKSIGGGLHAEGAYALVGPTGRGKTGLALQVSRAVAAHQPVLYFTSELSRRQILARAAAPILARPWSRLYGLPPDEAHIITVALEGLRLRTVEVRRETVLADVIARVSDADGAEPFVVVDYLQHAARRLVPDDLRLATAALMDQLTEWARASRSAALILSATARGFHLGNENRTATDFVISGKESGDVEYDAAGVFFLDCAPCPPGGTSSARLHVAKSRFQGTGATVGLRFDGALGCFAPDPEGALTEDQRDVFDAIRAGASSAEEVAKVLHKRNQHVVDMVAVLEARGMVARRPLRVVDR